MLANISKHLEVRRISNYLLLLSSLFSLFSVWKCGQIKHDLSYLIYFMIPKFCQLQLQYFAFAQNFKRSGVDHVNANGARKFPLNNHLCTSACTRAFSIWRAMARHIQALLCISSQFSRMFSCLAPTPTPVSIQDFELLKRSQLSEGSGYET